MANSKNSSHKNAWNPGVLKRLPWVGLAALLLMLCAMILACVIVVLSDGQETSSWAVAPPVLLALCSAASNAMAGVAFAEGAAISWWRGALNGMTVGELHRRWESSSDTWAAVTSLHKLRPAAIACVLVAVVAIDGPLLQRASSVVSTQRETSRTLQAGLSDRIPEGYTARSAEYSYTVEMYTPEFASLLSNFTQRDAIRVPGWGCDGTCEGSIQGAGLIPVCNQTTNTSYQLRDQRLPPKQAIFGVDFDWSTRDYNYSDSYNPIFLYLKLDTLYIQTHPGSSDAPKPDKYDYNPPCPGVLHRQHCELLPAVVEYPFKITNHTLTLTGDPKAPTVIQRQNITFDVNPGRWDYPSLSKALQSQFGSEFRIQPGEPDPGMGIGTNGSTAQNYLQSNPKFEFGSGWGCSFTFSDPNPDMLSNTYELMFRTALGAAQGNTSAVKTFDVLQTSPVVVFSSNYAYLAGALALMGVCLVAVAVTFHGWWILGRPTTMSPVEMARIFNAPLLASSGVPSSAHQDSFLDDVGSRPVRYGVLTVEDSEGVVLGMGTTNEVSAPIKGVVY